MRAICTGSAPRTPPGAGGSVLQDPAYRGEAHPQLVRELVLLGAAQVFAKLNQQLYEGFCAGSIDPLWFHQGQAQEAGDLPSGGAALIACTVDLSRQVDQGGQGVGVIRVSSLGGEEALLKRRRVHRGVRV